MSRLDDLIKSLCPDGVKYYNLGAIAELRSGWGFPVKEQGNKIAEIPFYKVADMNNSLIFMGEASNYVTHETAQKLKCNPAPKGTIIFPKVGATIRTDKKRIIVTDSCYDNNIMGVIAKESIVNSKYLYYYLSKVPLITFAKGEGAVPSISKESLSNFKLPIPPLEVQKEIVRLLDDFTAKTAELQTELNKEYEARKKQYECYRDNLIRNELHISKVINLIDIADVYDSLHQTPSYSINGYNMVRVQDIKGGYINIDKTLKVEETVWKLFTQKYVPQPNDVVVSRVGSYGNFALIPDNQCCLGQNVALIHPKINPQYLYYVLTSTMTKQWINNNVKGTSQKSLSLADIKRVPIPVPNENNQKCIADILNNFNITMDELQLNISIELESRQKQYEFYRDKLLTFKELS